MDRVLSLAAALALVSGIGLAGGVASADEIKELKTSGTGEQTQVAVASPPSAPVLVLKKDSQMEPLVETSDPMAFGDSHFCNKDQTAQSTPVFTVDTN